MMGLWRMLFVVSLLLLSTLVVFGEEEEVAPPPAKMGFFSRLGLKLGFYITEKCATGEKAQILLTEVKSLFPELDGNYTRAVKVSMAADTARIAIEAALPSLSSESLNATISNCKNVTEEEIEQHVFKIKVRDFFSNSLLLLGMLGYVSYAILQAHYVREKKIERIPKLEYVKYASIICQVLGYILKFSDLIVLTCKVCMVEWWQLILLFGAYAPHFSLFAYVLNLTQQHALLNFVATWKSEDKSVNHKKTFQWAVYIVTLMLVGVNVYRSWLLLEAYSSVFDDPSDSAIAISTIASNFVW